MERRLIGSNGLSSHHSTSSSHIHRPTNSFIPTSASVHGHGHHVHGSGVSTSATSGFIPSSKQHSHTSVSGPSGGSAGASSSANNVQQSMQPSHPHHPPAPPNGYFHQNGSGSPNLAHHHPQSQTSTSSSSQSMSHLQQHYHSYSTSARKSSASYSASALYGSSGLSHSVIPAPTSQIPGSVANGHGSSHHAAHQPPSQSANSSIHVSATGGSSSSSHVQNFYGVTTANSTSHHQSSVNTNTMNGHAHHVSSHHQIGLHPPSQSNQHHSQLQQHMTQTAFYGNGVGQNGIYGTSSGTGYHQQAAPASSGTPETEGLPQTLVDSMRTLFDILDDGKQGKIRLSDIESRWESDPNGTNGKVTGAEPLIKMGVMGYLRKVTPPDGMLTFERFCAGLRLALVTNNNNTSPTNHNNNNTSHNNNHTNISNHSNNNPIINQVLTKNAINSSVSASSGPTHASSNTLPLPSSHSGSHHMGTFHSKSNGVHHLSSSTNASNSHQSNSNTLPSGISKQSKLSVSSHSSAASATLQRSSKIPSLSSSSSSSRLPMPSSSSGIPVSPLNGHSRTGGIPGFQNPTTNFGNSHSNSNGSNGNHHNGPTSSIPHAGTNGTTSISSGVPSLSNGSGMSAGAINGPSANSNNNSSSHTGLSTMKRSNGTSSSAVSSAQMHHEQGTTIALVHHQSNGITKTAGIPTYSSTSSTLKISKQSSTPTLLSNSGIGRFLAKNGSLENLKTPSKDKIVGLNATKERPPSAPLLDNDMDHEDQQVSAGGGSTLLGRGSNQNSKDYYVKNNYGNNSVTHKIQSTTSNSHSVSNGNLNPNGVYTSVQYGLTNAQNSSTPSSNANNSFPVNVNTRRERARSRDRDREDQHHHHHRHTHHSQHRPKYNDESAEPDNQKRVNFVPPRQRTLSMPQLQLSKLTKPKSIIHIDDNSPPHGNQHEVNKKSSKGNSVSTVSLAVNASSLTNGSNSHHNNNNHNKSLPLPTPISYVSSIPTTNGLNPHTPSNAFNNQVKNKVDISPTISNSSTIPISGSSSNGSVSSGALETIIRSEKEYGFHYHSTNKDTHVHQQQPPPPPKPPRNAIQNNAPSMLVTSNLSTNEIIVTEVPPLVKPGPGIHPHSPEATGAQLNVMDSAEHTTVLSVNSSSVQPPPPVAPNPPAPPSKPEIRNVLQTWQRGLSEKKPLESTLSSATTATATSLSSASVVSAATNPSAASLLSTSLPNETSNGTASATNGSSLHSTPSKSQTFSYTSNLIMASKEAST